jgi:hypothetical protein
MAANKEGEKGSCNKILLLGVLLEVCMHPGTCARAMPFVYVMNHVEVLALCLCLARP